MQMIKAFSIRIMLILPVPAFTWTWNAVVFPHYVLLMSVSTCSPIRLYSNSNTNLVSVYYRALILYYCITGHWPHISVSLIGTFHKNKKRIGTLFRLMHLLRSCLAIKHFQQKIFTFRCVTINLWYTVTGYTHWLQGFQMLESTTLNEYREFLATVATLQVQTCSFHWFHML
jgi:hypothetical protein